MRSAVWRELKPYVWLVAVVIVYGILRLVFVGVAGPRGVLTPSGGVDNAVAVLALATFALRIIALVVVPMVVVYRLVWRVVELGRTRTQSKVA